MQAVIVAFMKSIKLLILAGATFCIYTSTLIKADAIDDAINAWMETNKVRAASVTFYDGSDPANVINFSRGYGKVSSSNDSAIVTADTPYQVASVSKVFTGMAVAALLEQGVINSIEEDICETIPPEWGRSACRNPNFPNYPVTWRMLITHRSGLASDVANAISPDTGDTVLAHYAPTGVNFYGLKTVYNPKCPLTDVRGFYRAVLTNDTDAKTTVGGGKINWFETMENDSNNRGAWTRRQRPDRRYIYSNLAFGYVPALVELKTSMSYESFCQKYLFKRLSMNNTSWFRENLKDASKHAVPVYYSEEKASFVDYGHNCYIDYGSGQLYTTVNDIGKFLRSMFTKGVPTLWSKRVGDAILACADGVQPCSRSYRTGFGWVLLNNSLKKEWNFGKQYNWTDGGYHYGGTYGVSTMMMVLPSSNVYASALTNVENVDASELVSIVAKALTK